MKPLGIVVATRWEASPILRAFHFKPTEKNLYRFEHNGAPVYLAISGVGKEPARQAAYRLCAVGAKELISMGFCGALSETLKVGDLVTDRIATVSVPVGSREDRLTLAEKASAQAVDMETQAVIEAGTRRGVPIRILRVVSDTLNDDVSPLVGSTGNFSPFHIALRLWNPRLWPMALKLKRQSQIAHQRLVQALGEYLKTAT